MIVGAEKLPLAQRWKHRRASKPKTPIALKPAAALALAPAPTPIVAEALTLIERNQIVRWVAAQIITWPPDNCLHCRRPIIYGAKWVEAVSDNGRARFHADCRPEWLAQQEVRARRALGLDP